MQSAQIQLRDLRNSLYYALPFDGVYPLSPDFVLWLWMIEINHWRNWNFNLYWVLWSKKNQSSRMLGRMLDSVLSKMWVSDNMLSSPLWFLLGGKAIFNSFFVQKFPTVGERGQKSWPRTTLPSNKSSLFKVSYSISFTLLWS